MGDKLKFVLIAAVIGGLVSGMVGVAFGRLTVREVLPIEPDTDSWTKDWCGVGNPDFYARGHFGEKFGGAGEHNGEIYERSTIWYSWTAQGESFPLISSLELSNCGAIIGPTYPNQIFYKWLYTEDKKSWVGFGTEKYPQGFMKVDAPGWTGWVVGEIGSQVFTVNGYTFHACTKMSHDRINHIMSCDSLEEQEIADGAVVRVEIWGGNDKIIGGYEDTLLGYDELQLRSAIPYISRIKPQYKVGETAQWDYRIPTSTTDDGSHAYFVQVLDCNTNSPLEGWDKKPLTEESGRISIPVTEEMISNDLGTCQNRLRALLWSELIVAAISDASLWSDTVVETGMTMPAVTSIEFDKGWYNEGDQIVLTWKAEGNITKYHVTIDINGMIVMDDDVDGNVNVAKVSAAKAGTAQAQVTPYNKCFTGEVKRDFAVISGAPPNICEAYPELPFCKDGDGIDLVALVIAALAIIFLLIGFTVMVFLFARYDVDLMTGLLVAGVVVLVVTMILIGLGVFDVLLLQLAGGVVA